LTGRLANILFRPTLAAELKKLSNEKLIQNLRSPNSSVQREAGALLAEDGPEQLIKVMESLHKDPNNRRVQKGTLAVLSTIMNNDVDAKLVRGKLTKADVSAIAKLIGDNDRLLGNEAALTTAYLNDPRANETLSDIVMGQYSSYAKVKAASVLNQNFNYFTDPQKSRLKSKLAPSFSSYDLRIQELTKGIINYRPDRAPTKTGWVYLGTNFGSGWDEHYFSTKTKSEIPKPGDDLTTTGNINIRKDHIKFDPKKGWTNAPSIGVLKTNQTVRVKKLKIVAGGFYWAQIERR
jgi:hypothetical protein